MADSGGIDPVKARVLLVDPASLAIVWMNESATEALPDRDRDVPESASLGAVVPMAEEIGVPEALAAVARDGVARHVRTDLVSTVRGSVAIVVSMYRLPEGMLLLIMENAWQPTLKPPPQGGTRRSGRRSR